MSEPTLEEFMETNISNDEFTISGPSIDTFFTSAVLKSQLRKPLSNYTKTIVEPYTRFNSFLQNILIEKKLFVHKLGSSFISNVLFKTHECDVMLTTLSLPEHSLQFQTMLSLTELMAVSNCKESNVTVANEDIPNTVRVLINALTVNGLDFNKIKLFKTITDTYQRYFFFLNSYIEGGSNIEKDPAITTIAGFQINNIQLVNQD